MSTVPTPDPIADFLAGLTDQQLLALLLLGEARGEDKQGREMVASVVLNRVSWSSGYRTRHNLAYYWGESVRDVILHPYSFSCFNAHDPNRRLLTAFPHDSLWAESLAVAGQALDGELGDQTGGATGYLNPAVVKSLPSWATPDRFTVRHLHHDFYRLV